MVAQEHLSLLQDTYGFVFEDELIAEIMESGQYRKIRAGEILIDVSQRVEAMPLLLSGAIKIMREDDEGHELLLYYLETGDTCAMSFSCCMASKKSRVRAIAEEDSEVIMLPTEYMSGWLGKYQSWKTYVFQSIDVRMDEFLESIDTLAFMKLDERLAKYLRDKAMVTGSAEIHNTHREIAADLNTSRVVVSRLLKQLEKEGKISVSRNKIVLLELA